MNRVHVLPVINPALLRYHQYVFPISEGFLGDLEWHCELERHCTPAESDHFSNDWSTNPGKHRLCINTAGLLEPSFSESVCHIRAHSDKIFVGDDCPKQSFTSSVQLHRCACCLGDPLHTIRHFLVPQAFEL